MWHRCSRFAVALMVLLAGVLIASVEFSTRSIPRRCANRSPGSRRGVDVAAQGRSGDAVPRHAPGDSETFRGSWVYWEHPWSFRRRLPRADRQLMTGFELWIATYPARPRPGAPVSMARPVSDLAPDGSLLLRAGVAAGGERPNADVTLLGLRHRREASTGPASQDLRQQRRDLANPPGSQRGAEISIPERRVSPPPRRHRLTRCCDDAG